MHLSADSVCVRMFVYGLCLLCMVYVYGIGISMVFYFILLYCTALDWIGLDWIGLCCGVLCCVVLCCVVLCCVVSYCSTVVL